MSPIVTLAAMSRFRFGSSSPTGSRSASPSCGCSPCWETSGPGGSPSRCHLWSWRCHPAPLASVPEPHPIASLRAHCRIIICPKLHLRKVDCVHFGLPNVTVTSSV